MPHSPPRSTWQTLQKFITISTNVSELQVPVAVLFCPRPTPAGDISFNNSMRCKPRIHRLNICLFTILSYIICLQNSSIQFNLRWGLGLQMQKGIYSIHAKGCRYIPASGKPRCVNMIRCFKSAEFQDTSRSFHNIFVASDQAPCEARAWHQQCKSSPHVFCVLATRKSTSRLTKYVIIC